MIIDDIVKWIEEQPYWQQVIAKKILDKSHIYDEDIEDFFSIFMKYNNLEHGNFNREKIEFRNITNTTDEHKIANWKGLDNVIGVNAIKDNANLVIGPQLTLIYGENGSGKSGFTRLLNNIFISRGDTRLLSNIFNDNPSPPSANINFETNDGNIDKLYYPKDSNHPYTDHVSVFDSHSALHDLTQESELSFSPTEFKFFDELLEIVQKLKEKFEAKINDKTLDNTFINHFDKETSIKRLLLNLNTKNDLDELKIKVKLTEKDMENHANNNKRMSELQSMQIFDKKQEYQNLISILKDVKKTIKKLNQFFSSAYLSEVKDLIEERNHYKDVSLTEGIAQFKDENIEKLGSKEWKDFIESAYKYYTTINHSVNYCIFCHQDISNIKLIDKYWKYLKNESEKILAVKNNSIKDEERRFKLINTTILNKDSILSYFLKDDNIDLFNSINQASNNFENLKDRVLKALNNLQWDSQIKGYNFDYNEIEKVINNLNNLIENLDEDSVKKEIEELQIKENEFNDKLKVEKLLPKIEDFINNKEWVDNANKIKINTRSITSKQNSLFSKYVTDTYIETFNNECQKLNANFSAEIKQRGRKGTTLNKLTIQEKKPIDILSEGEQRAIALANFLSETSMNKNNVCIVFDDPVSSLDHKRKEIIADRLIDEAQQKQVVIFTHDLPFLLLMQNKSSEKQLDCCHNTLRKIKNETGISTNSHPWISMTVKKRIGYLKKQLQNITTYYNNISSDAPEEQLEYSHKAKMWCEELRETWEKSIEELLLNGSIERFNPAIQTSRLKKAPFNRELYEEVEKGMTESSKWVHDRSSALGEETPNPEQLKEYIDDLEEFTKKLKKLIK